MEGRLFLTLVLLIAAAPAAAQDVLPVQVSGWTPSPIEKFDVNSAARLGGADAAVLLEYGFLSAERQTFTRDSQSRTVTVYRFRDPSGAYGTMTFWSGRPQKSEAADFGATADGKTLALKGNLLVSITGPPGAADEFEIGELLKKAAVPADTAPYPSLPRYLPQSDAALNSARYILGPRAFPAYVGYGKSDWLGFEVGAEVALAKYKLNGKEATLILAAYPTPQGAAGRLRAWATQFALNPQQGATPGKPVLYARRLSHIIAIVPDAPSKEVADQLLSQVRYETKITWNEPSFKAKGENFALMMYQAFLFSGVVCLYAVLSGIVFGFVRVLVKHFLPEMIFDRPGSIEVIRLNINSHKSLESKDLG